AAQTPLPVAKGFMTVTPPQAQQLINSRKGLVMIDVRTPQELANGVIKGSHNVPLWPVMQGKLNLPKDTPLLVICAVGGRSYAAGQALVKWGFQEVYNLKGGIDGWKQAGLPLQ
ncbi:MAG: rhodanese-like domain-containing protein, partial [Desulfobulbaceae bacterium]|nr:rhodanese-like domain-containing protein [Desulfobulbaceae bacterium]